MFNLKGITRLLTAGFIMALMPVIAWSGTNPVSFTLVPATGFPSTTNVGSSYAVQITLRNNLPFPVKIKNVTHSVNGVGFSVEDECNGKTLAARTGTCIVNVDLAPVTAGPVSIKVYAYYDNNVVQIPTLSSTAQGGGSSGDIVGITSNPLPGKTEVGTTYPVTFTYTNKGTVAVTASSVQFTGNTGNFANIVNGCLSPIEPTYPCTITGDYTPTTTGAQSIGATYFYNSGSSSVPLVSHTVSHNGSGGCVSVDGSGVLLLPSTTYQYADNVVKFKFTNHCDAVTATLGQVTFSGLLNGAAIPTSWITPGTGTNDGCSNQTLAANGSCYVLASLVPQTTGSNLQIIAAAPYTQSGQSKTAKATSTSSSVQANNGTNRLITFVNQCSVPVWTTFYPGAVPYPTGYNCKTKGCQTGSVCASNGHCYYKNPSLDGTHSKGLLAAAVANTAPDTMTVTVSENYSGTNPQGGVVYNGSMIPRLGCVNIPPSGSNTNNLLCTVNNCGGLPAAPNTTQPDGQCTPSTGAPSSGGGFSFNLGEVTFIRSSINNGIDGVYDSSNINGIAVPIEVKGRGPYTTTSVYTAPYNNCNATGSVLQPAGNTLGGCSYNFVTPTDTPTVGIAAVPSSYRYVNAASPTVDCSSNENICTGTDVCGLYYDQVANKIYKRCGQLEGYAAIFEGICTNNTLDSSISSLATDYKCTTTFGTNTGANLYGCSGSGGAAISCYGAANSNNTCGGCVNWWQAAGGSLPVPNTTALCNSATIPTSGYNSNWYSLVVPQIQWVKAACPTAYAYQFDDPSSSYTCTVVNNTNSTIVTNYQVTFCPGGKEVSTITPPV